MEKIHGARDEGSRVELGPGRKAGSGQTTMAFLGVGLMCEHARTKRTNYYGSNCLRIDCMCCWLDGALLTIDSEQYFDSYCYRDTF